MPSHEKKITLSELSVQDVFDARMELETWQSDEQQARKARLNSLYLEIAEQTQLANSPNDALAQHTEANYNTEAKADINADKNASVKPQTEPK
jgi:exonuclease SbcD